MVFLGENYLNWIFFFLCVATSNSHINCTSNDTASLEFKWKYQKDKESLTPLPGVSEKVICQRPENRSSFPTYNYSFETYYLTGMASKVSST